MSATTELGLEPFELGALTGYNRRIAYALAWLRDAWSISSHPRPIEDAIRAIFSDPIFRLEHHRRPMVIVLTHGMDKSVIPIVLSRVLPEGER